MPFLILFLVLPFLEIMVFLAVADEAGIGMALLLILLSAIAGGLLLRYQGLMTLGAARRIFREGDLPLDAVFDSICLAIAGVLFIVPGFITDMLALALLVPVFRHALRRGLKGYKDTHPRGRRREGEIIEADYERIDEE